MRRGSARRGTARNSACLPRLPCACREQRQRELARAGWAAPSRALPSTEAWPRCQAKRRTIINSVASQRDRSWAAQAGRLAGRRCHAPTRVVLHTLLRLDVLLSVCDCNPLRSQRGASADGWTRSGPDCGQPPPPPPPPSQHIRAWKPGPALEQHAPSPSLPPFPPASSPPP